MSNLEHYFENLLFYGEDVVGDLNKNSLPPEVQDAVEQCADYVLYSLFGNRKLFLEWNRLVEWHRREMEPHGNLIDADAMIRRFEEGKEIVSRNGPEGFAELYGLIADGMIDEIRKAPVVIKAKAEEDDR